ncbi:hypothetical protein ACHAWO_004144 [Cyclotella atomus]|uniref:Glyoxalase/fosfomycin resistance/dioxygenase domain-containing protein n=1 Tax=Cyclotella atomus TaxID=382360 RepID=A0ABD3NZR9_9STRA
MITFLTRSSYLLITKYPTMAATSVLLLLHLIPTLLLLSPTSSFILPASSHPTIPPLSAMTSSTNNLSIGPSSLRTLLQTASKSLLQNEQGLDLQGIVWMEHLNLVVGSMDVAKEFYVDFLGCTVDEGNEKHFNLGQQQFHLAANNDPPQRIIGSICLTVPSLNKIRSRAEAASAALSGTLFSIQEYDDNPNVMTVTCPYGNIFHLYDISIDDEMLNGDINSNAQLSPHKMVNLHKEGGTYGSDRMAVRGQPGIRAVEIACRRGTAAKIARFFETYLNCNVVQLHAAASEDNDNDPNQSNTAIVSVGPGVQIVFIENDGNDNILATQYEEMKGVHICIYISNFASTYRTLQESNLIWTNPRFTHLDTCDTWGEAYASRTFRFKDIVDENGGEVMLELEFETRPMMHGQYLKVPRYISN